ncbi:DUF3800 domain-containing protein [Bacteroides sedimenti]
MIDIKYKIEDFRRAIKMLPIKHLFDITTTFYYDETDNVRKYYLKETGINEQIDRHFVLGGIMLKEDINPPDVKELREKLRIPEELEEIKSKHVYNGDIFKVLDKREINPFLNWILNHDIYIHYSVANLYYYSLVDIVDSIIDEELYGFHFYLKDDLYQIAKADHNQFNNILYKYNYPNISHEDIVDFLVDLRGYISGNKLDTTHYIDLLIERIEDENISELPFIQDEEDLMLLKDLSQFYYYPIYTFHNSKHIFDHERQIEDNHFKGVTFTKNGIPFNSYEFKDSKDDSMIQLSDCVVGIISRFYKFLDEFDGSLTNLDKRLNSRQKENLSILCKIIKKSVDYNETLIHMIVPIKEQQGYNIIVSHYSK